MIWVRGPQGRLPADAPEREGGKAGTLTDCGGCDNCANIEPHIFHHCFDRFLLRPLIMIKAHSPRSVAAGLAVLVLVSGTLNACRRKEAPTPPLATPSVTLNHEKTPLGSPIDITYKFVV